MKMRKQRRMLAALAIALMALVLLPVFRLRVAADPGHNRTDEVYINYGDSVTLTPDLSKINTSNSEVDINNLEYKWYDMDSGFIEGATSKSYTTGKLNSNATYEVYISSPDTDWTYRYAFQVIINNDFSARAVGNTTVKVPYGESATLEVSATCTKGSLTYKWEKSGSIDTIGDTSKLKLQSVTEVSNYKCIVTDMYGTTEYIYFHVGIENGLKASAVGGTDKAVAYGKSITLQVKASCNRGELSYAWYKSPYYSEKEKIGTESSCTLSSVKELTGVRCIITDEFGNSMTVDFKVSVENGFSVEPVGGTMRNAQKGESVKLAVKASCNNGGLTYKWRKGYDDISGAKGSFYTVTADTGITHITCYVEDIYGNSKSVEFTVVVLSIAADDTDCVYVLTWDDSINHILRAVEKYHNIDNVKVINMGMSGTGSEYIAMVKGYTEKYPDTTFIVVAENDSLEKLVSAGEFMDIDKLGITDAYRASYPYIRKAATFNGKLKAMAWYACPGTFMYDPDIAQKVLGTSDPAKIQEMIGTAEGFLSVAAKMKAHGYSMTSGAAGGEEDMLNGILYNMTGDSRGYSNPPRYGLTTSQIATARKIADGIASNGYDTGSWSWSDDWFDDMKSGNVFGWFSSTWAAGYTILFDKPMSVCQGPLPYYWGGTFVGVNSGKADKQAAELLEMMCCNVDVQADFASKGDFPNNTLAVARCVADGKNMVTLKGNQNIYSEFDKMARAIDGAPYKINEQLILAGSNGIVKGLDGVYYYVKNGAVQTSKTGFVTVDGKTYYVKSGVWQNNTTGFVRNGNTKYYVKKGVRSTTTGFVKVGKSKYYVKKGALAGTKTGLVKVGKKKYYVKKGVLAGTKTGLVKVGKSKYYVKKGVFAGTKTGFVKVGKKKYYVKKGVFAGTKTGFVKVGKKKYYVKKGVLAGTKTGLVKVGKKYYYIVKGVQKNDTTGIIKLSKGKRYYIRKGVWQKTYSGKVTYKKHMYKIVKGVVTKKIK